MVRMLQTLIIIRLFFVYPCTGAKFGSFDLLVTKFDQCKGPKRKDCAVAVGTISEQYNLDYDIVVKDNVRTTKAKIVILTRGKETLRLQVKDPCEHLFLKPLLQSMLNITKDCLVAKGHYHFNVDIQDVARKYYGGAFLFGTWTFRSVFYNDVCNFSCSVIEVVIAPKNKTEHDS